jgi:FKBP-type peptidyl-prolyl cis-trans isomerase (trigger factor)
MKFEELAKSFSLEKGARSSVTLKGEVPADIIGEYRQTALTNLAAQMELPGFRKGHVPHELALKKVGEMAVLEEAVELFARDFYPELLESKKLDVVGRPNIAITKMAPGNPVALNITVAVYPEVSVPKNWKELGAKIAGDTPLPATDEEVEKTLESLRQSRKGPSLPDGKDGHLPELNDEFAKSLGAFENLEALKVQVKKGIGEEKVRAARDARRGKIIDALLAQVKVEVPDVFVESELDKILAQMREDVGRMGMQFDEYLKRANKTEEGIRKEFRQQAEKRAVLQLTLNKLAADEKIEAEKEAVEAEMKHALQHLPAGRQASPIDDERLRIYIETILRNEKVLQLLEGEGEPQ